MVSGAEGVRASGDGGLAGAEKETPHTVGENGTAEV
jgi:hypothetical protein